jgi:hypothetical protein
MHSPWIHAQLVAWLERNRAAPEAIEAYSRRWARLREQDRLPCPNCFTQEEGDQPLAALAAADGVEPLVCEHCHTRYSIPVRE